MNIHPQVDIWKIGEKHQNSCRGQNNAYERGHFFSKSIIKKLFQKKNKVDISPYFVLYPNFRDFSEFSIYRLVS